MEFNSTKEHANYTATLIKRLFKAKSYSVTVSQICAILCFTTEERPDLALISRLLRDNDSFFISSNPDKKHYTITLELHTKDDEEFKYEIN